MGRCSPPWALRSHSITTSSSPFLSSLRASEPQNPGKHPKIWVISVESRLKAQSLVRGWANGMHLSARHKAPPLPFALPRARASSVSLKRSHGRNLLETTIPTPYRCHPHPLLPHAPPYLPCQTPTDLSETLSCQPNPPID